MDEGLPEEFRNLKIAEVEGWRRQGQKLKYRVSFAELSMTQEQLALLLRFINDDEVEEPSS